MIIRFIWLYFNQYIVNLHLIFICLYNVIIVHKHYLQGSHAISDEFITNKALYRPSNQSSSYSGIPQCGRLTASKAVDGNADPDVFKCHCFHTNDVYNDPNWMAVDLGERYKMYYVNVFGRIGMEKRLDSFFCGLTNNFLSNSVQRYTYPLCGQYPGAFPPSRKAVMKCIYNLPPGRFLILQMDPSSGDGKGMAVCEVEAYDLPVRSFVGNILGSVKTLCSF